MQGDGSGDVGKGNGQQKNQSKRYTTRAASSREEKNSGRLRTFYIVCMGFFLPHRPLFGREKMTDLVRLFCFSCPPLP